MDCARQPVQASTPQSPSESGVNSVDQYLFHGQQKACNRGFMEVAKVRSRSNNLLFLSTVDLPGIAFELFPDQTGSHCLNPFELDVRVAPYNHFLRFYECPHLGAQNFSKFIIVLAQELHLQSKPSQLPRTQDEEGVKCS